MTKQEIRKIYKEKRISLSPQDKLKLDDLLLIQFQRISLQDNIQVLMSYWPFEQHGEMNTLLYTRYMEHAIPALKVTFPVINSVSNNLQAMLVHEETDFVENKYGIPEPESIEEIPPKDIDIVFVPLLAFDNHGYRVGYGKGYYDRFLKQCREDVMTVGFSYFGAVNIDDTHDYDIPLNYCITPNKFYEF